MPPRLRNTLVAISVLGLAWGAIQLDRGGSEPPAIESARQDASGITIRDAFERELSGVVIESAGRVDKVLRDDNDGSRHQRFILRLDSGDTLLVAHNIDVAPRVPLDRGDALSFRGQYEWNSRGGVLHWTHHDPAGRRPGGWIRHEGELYK